MAIDLLWLQASATFAAILWAAWPLFVAALGSPGDEPHRALLNTTIACGASLVMYSLLSSFWDSAGGSPAGFLGLTSYVRHSLLSSRVLSTRDTVPSSCSSEVAVAGVTCGAVIMTGIAFSMLEPICALLVGLAGGAIGAVGNYLLKPRSMLVIVHNFLPLGFLQRTIVKASNFELCGNFGPFLASSVASLIKLCIKNEQNRICRSKFFHNFHSVHLSVGRVLMITNPSGKQSKVYMRSTVRGFHGNAMLSIQLVGLIVTTRPRCWGSTPVTCCRELRQAWRPCSWLAWQRKQVMAFGCTACTKRGHPSASLLCGSPREPRLGYCLTSQLDMDARLWRKPSTSSVLWHKRSSWPRSAAVWRDCWQLGRDFFLFILRWGYTYWAFECSVVIIFT